LSVVAFGTLCKTSQIDRFLSINFSGLDNLPFDHVYDSNQRVIAGYGPLVPCGYASGKGFQLRGYGR